MICTSMQRPGAQTVIKKRRHNVLQFVKGIVIGHGASGIVKKGWCRIAGYVGVVPALQVCGKQSIAQWICGKNFLRSSIMKKLLAWVALWVLVLGWAVSFYGCMQQTDPTTGQQQTVVDPNAVIIGEESARAAIGIMAALAPLVPWAAPVGTALAAALGTWLKLKPQVTSAKDEVALYNEVTKLIIKMVEDYKAADPDVWNNTIKPKYEKLIGPKVLAVIEAIRQGADKTI